MNILVVGANSRLSQELIRLLNQDGSHGIYGLCNINTNNITEKAHYLNMGELKDSEMVIDVVVHVASYIPYGNWEVFTSDLLESNLRLPLEISQLFPAARFVFCSSVSVYGNARESLTENSSVKPANAYAFTKVAGEIIASSHPSFAIIRISSIVGQGVNTPTFIPRAIKQAKDDGRIVLFGDGSRRQNYIDYTELAELLKKAALGVASGVFLGVSDRSYSNREVAEMIANILPNTSIEYQGHDESNSAIFDPSLTKQVWGLSDSVPLEKRIETLVHGR